LAQQILAAGAVQVQKEMTEQLEQNLEVQASLFFVTHLHLNVVQAVQ
jgi:hypothetical protein